MKKKRRENKQGVAEVAESRKAGLLGAGCVGAEPELQTHIAASTRSLPDTGAAFDLELQSFRHIWLRKQALYQVTKQSLEVVSR